MDTRLQHINTLLSKELNKKHLRSIDRKLSDYIQLRGNRYVLTLSKEKCKKMGISSLEYQRIVLDLEKTNRFIAQVERESGQELSSEEKTFGWLVANDGTMVTEKVWIPLGYKFVRFKCWANVALTPGFTCRTKSSGEEIRTKSAKKTLFSSDWPIIDVPLAASRCGGEVGFITTDSNGGKARWELMK